MQRGERRPRRPRHRQAPQQPFAGLEAEQEGL